MVFTLFIYFVSVKRDMMRCITNKCDL